MTITKADIVNRLADATGLTKTDVEVIVNGFLFNVIEALQENNRVEIRGFGSFYSKERGPRQVKNPRTNKVMDIDHRFVPVFRPAKHFRESVNQSLLTKRQEKSDE